MPPAAVKGNKYIERVEEPMKPAWRDFDCLNNPTEQLCKKACVAAGIIHYGQRIVEDMAEGLSDWMDDKKFKNLAQVVGKSLKHTVPTDAFDLSRQGRADFDLDKCIGYGQC
jgi:hypothetical protein